MSDNSDNNEEAPPKRGRGRPRKDNAVSYTVDYLREYQRKYRKANKERLEEARIAYEKKHAERIREQKRVYAGQNKAQIIATQKALRAQLRAARLAAGAVTDNERKVLLKQDRFTPYFTGMNIAFKNVRLDIYEWMFAATRDTGLTKSELIDAALYFSKRLSRDQLFAIARKRAQEYGDNPERFRYSIKKTTGSSDPSSGHGNDGTPPVAE